jgi:copper homeostasis protein CutC
MVLFEACVDSVESALAAQAGGAARVELCDALVEGGLTPSLGKIRTVVAALRRAAAGAAAVATADSGASPADGQSESPSSSTLAAAPALAPAPSPAAPLALPIPVHVLIRPRGGDFVYDADELDAMEIDIGAAADAGASGVVIGVLRPAGAVDLPSTARLVRAASACGLAITFHRAVDVAADPVGAVATIAAAFPAITRVLTSGGAPSALEGAATLRAMAAAAAAASGPPAAPPAAPGSSPATARSPRTPRREQPLRILAGGGVTPETACALILASGVSEVHGTARPAGWKAGRST